MKKIESIIEKLGFFIIFNSHIFMLFFTKPLRLDKVIEQIEFIGVKSFGVIFLTAVFTGMVESIQLYHGFSEFGVEDFMGYTIFISISRELAPVFATLMVISRAISAMTAELGTMKVTEQIDAIETLAVDSKHYLINPRVLATIISLPLLIIIFNFVSNMSSFLIAWFVLNMNPIVYIDTIKQFLHFSDIGIGIAKGIIFGYLIGSIGAYIGYNTKGGAKGVGLSTTEAVVISATTMFISNYFLSMIFISLKW